VDPVWLSHHRKEHAHKCFRVGRLSVCSRCLGTYPVLLAGLVLQLLPPLAPAEMPTDVWVLYGLPVPAVLDWAISQFRPSWGTNPARCFTGVLLGVGLSRAVYRNMRHPGDPLVLGLFAALGLIAAVVWPLSQMLRSRPSAPPTDRADDP
jgi:uncharacterized membrane protein